MLIGGLSSNSQTFTFSLPPNIMSGNPGDIFNADVTFSNTSVSLVTLRVIRFQRGLPPYWYSCYCYIQCHSYLDDSIDVVLQPFSTQTVTLQFRTDSVNPGAALSKFKVYQTGFQNNADIFQLYVSTGGPLEIRSEQAEAKNILLFPNPASETIYFSLPTETIHKIKIYDCLGRLTEKCELEKNAIDVTRLEKGIYLMEVYTEKNKFKKSFIKN